AHCHHGVSGEGNGSKDACNGDEKSAGHGCILRLVSGCYCSDLPVKRKVTESTCNQLVRGLPFKSWGTINQHRQLPPLFRQLRLCGCIFSPVLCWRLRVCSGCRIRQLRKKAPRGLFL